MRPCSLPLIFVAVCGLDPALLAGPPLETDDPGTPGPERWEINVSSTVESRRDSTQIQPLLDINYGIGNSIQLKLKPRAVVLDESGEPERAGAGNIQLGVKWRFFDNGSGNLAMSFYPQVDLNPPGSSSDRGLVEEGAEFILPFQVLRSFGRTRVYAEASYVLQEHRSDEWVLGLAAEHSLTDGFWVAGELRRVAECGGGERLFFNAGFKWALSEGCALLASAGKTLHETGDESAAVYSYLGLQFTL